MNIKTMMIKSAAQRAKKAGVPFTIKESDLIIPSYCPVFGVKLEQSLGSKGPGVNSPSLDRRVPEDGYIPGNIVVISYRANRAKSDLTVDELCALADFYRNNKR